MINCATPGKQENEITIPDRKKLIKHVTVLSFSAFLAEKYNIWCPQV